MKSPNIQSGYLDAVTQKLMSESGIDYSYRDLERSDVPLVALIHFRETLDNWDPALIDALGAQRRVITFDNVGVGGTSGTPASTIEQMARGAIDFIETLNL